MPHMHQPSQAPHQMAHPQHQLQIHQQHSSESFRYRSEVFSVFSSDMFMQTQSDQMKKQMIGTAIFKYVTNMVTSDFAPKITGMIIDLPIGELNFAVSTYETLVFKCKSAVQLLVETRNLSE